MHWEAVVIAARPQSGYSVLCDSSTWEGRLNIHSLCCEFKLGMLEDE